MATDKLFYDFCIRFPDALPALLGFSAPAGFRGTSVNLKDTELRNDVVLVPEGLDSPRLLIEFQGYQDPWILHRVVAEAGLYGYKEKYTGTLHLVVVFTREAWARQLEPVRWGLEHGEASIRPRLVVLDDNAEQAVRATGRVELMVLLPLCVSPERVEAEARLWRSQIEASPLPAVQRRELVALLGGFITHRLGRLTVQQLTELLGGFKMEDTQVGRELIEMGRLRGEVSSRREDILEVLFVRFGKTPPDVLSLLARLEDPEQARELHRLALRADSLAAFTTRLREILD